MAEYSVALNWHAPRETEKVEKLCTFLEENGLRVHRWGHDEATMESRVHVRVIVVCQNYWRLSKFQRELTIAKESKTPLAWFWIGSEPNRDTLGDKLFDELVYDNDQDTYFKLIHDKIVDIAPTVEWEEETFGWVVVKRQQRKAVLITVLTLISLTVMGLLIGYTVRSEAKSKLRSQFCELIICCSR